MENPPTNWLYNSVIVFNIQKMIWDSPPTVIYLLEDYCIPSSRQDLGKL